MKYNIMLFLSLFALLSIAPDITSSSTIDLKTVDEEVGIAAMLQMPSADVLLERLAGIGLGYFAEKTSLVEELADKKNLRWEYLWLYSKLWLTTKSMLKS